MRHRHTSLACRLEVCKNGDVAAPIAYPKHSLVTATGPGRLPPLGVVAYGLIPAVSQRSHGAHATDLRGPKRSTVSARSALLCRSAAADMCPSRSTLNQASS